MVYNFSGVFCCDLFYNFVIDFYCISGRRGGGGGREEKRGEGERAGKEGRKGWEEGRGGGGRGGRKKGRGREGEEKKGGRGVVRDEGERRVDVLFGASDIRYRKEAWMEEMEKEQEIEKRIKEEQRREREEQRKERIETLKRRRKKLRGEAGRTAEEIGANWSAEEEKLGWGWDGVRRGVEGKKEDDEGNVGLAEL